MVESRMSFHSIPVSPILLCLGLLAACGGSQSGNSGMDGDGANASGARGQEARPMSHAPSSEDHLALGGWLWSRKDFDKAEAEFRKAIDEHPESSQGYARLAGLLLTQNRISEAIPLYQEAIMRDPKNPKLFASLSIAYLHQSSYSMARSMAREALELAPDMAQVRKLNEYIDARQHAGDRARSGEAGQSSTGQAAGDAN